MPSVNIRGAFDLWFETAGDEEKGGPIVLLHGFTGTHSTWSGLQMALFRQGYFIISPDLPGHGLSGYPSRTEEMDVGATSGAIETLLDHLSVKRASAVLGYSLGARIALHYALGHQGSTSCLILEGGTPGIRDAHERETREAEDAALCSYLMRYGLERFVDKWEAMPIFATQGRNLAPSDRKRLREERLSNKRQGLAMSLRAAGTGGMRPMWERLAGLQIPVLLIVGGEDKKFVDTASAMASILPRCTLSVVEGAGHAVHLEKPDEFQEAVSRFLVGSRALPDVRVSS